MPDDAPPAPPARPAAPSPAALWPAGAPVLVSGPCALESEDDAFAVARGLAALRDALGLRVVFKASFDKANRTSGTTYRGPGLAGAAALLRAIRAETALPLLLDVHEPAQAEPAAEVADVLQIPAFLCRQTDLLRAAAATGRVVNLKKGQFLAPWQVAPAVEKLEGAAQIWVTERGSSFGHGDLVVDFRAVDALRATGCRLLFDAGHAAQRPGGEGDRSGGDRAVIPALAGAAAGAGFDGLYVEAHPEPARARSDAATQWPLERLPGLVARFLAVRAARLASAEP